MSEISTVELGDLIEFQRGFDLPKSEMVEGEYPVRSSNSILGYHNEYKVTGPGITIGRSGTVGIPHLIKTNFFPHNTSLFIKDFKGNNVEYIYYLLKNLKLRDRKSGSGVPTMNRNHLHPLGILAFTDNTIQSQIAKVLSDLDAKIELNNKINAELEAMAKLIYDYWFVQFDFPDENGKPYKSSGGKMVFNEELKREIPEGWESGELADIGTIKGGSTPSKKEEDNFSNNGIPWITPKDLSMNSGKKFITKGEIDASEKGVKDASLKTLPKGTVLLSCRAPIGYMVIARQDLTTNQGFKSFVPNKGYSSEYIYYSIQSSMKVIEQNASGSTFKEISGSVLKSITTCLPAKNVRNKFINKVQTIFKRQDLLELENQKLSELRDWLLPMLMNGQVSVGEAEEKWSMAAEPEAHYNK